jgi:hypothetical protein
VLDDGVREGQRLGPPLDEEPRQVQQQPLKVLPANLDEVDLRQMSRFVMFRRKKRRKLAILTNIIAI